MLLVDAHRAMKELVLIQVFMIPLLFDWGFVAEGNVRIAAGGSSDELIYAQQPVTQITQEDRLIETKAGTSEPDKKAGKTQTGAIRKKVRPPRFPPMVTVAYSSQITLPAFTADAKATDVPTHLGSGEQMPVLDPALYRKDAYELFLKEFQTNFPDFTVQDPLVENFKYGDISSTNGRIESFYKCFLRCYAKRFANNRTLDREDQFYLTLFGDPAGFHAAKAIIWQTKDFDENYIGFEDKAPELPSGTDDYDTMMKRLVVSELFVSYSFATTVKFAPGLSNFADEYIYPYVKEMLNHPNRRVRRNAVYYLGLMQKYEPLSDLFDILKNTKDNVMKARALYFLTISNYPGLKEYLADRLKTEADPVFKVAIVNSLRRIGDGKAFPALVEQLEKAGFDFELVYPLLKACTVCFDGADKDNVVKFTNICRRLYGTDPKGALLVDPPSQIMSREITGSILHPGFGETIKVIITIEAMGDQTGVRHSMLKQLLEVIAISTGIKLTNSNIAGEYADKLTVIGQNLGEARSVSGSEGLALAPWQSLIRGFILRNLPKLIVNKKNIGKWFLERLILSGYESENLLIEALNVYATEFAEDYPKLVEPLLSKDLLPSVQDRALKLLYFSGKYSDAVEKMLVKLIRSYKPDLREEKKHLIALAIYYLAQGNKLKDVDLIRIVVSELPLIKDDDMRKVRAAPAFLDINLKSDNHLPYIAVEALGLTRTKKAESTLIGLSKAANLRIRRLVCKALGYFNTDNTKKRLSEMLSDSDGWTRLIAYQNLFRFSGKEKRVDWFFTNPADLKDAVSDYAKIVIGKQ